MNHPEGASESRTRNTSSGYLVSATGAAIGAMTLASLFVFLGSYAALTEESDFGSVVLGYLLMGIEVGAVLGVGLALSIRKLPYKLTTCIVMALMTPVLVWLSFPLPGAFSLLSVGRLATFPLFEELPFPWNNAIAAGTSSLLPTIAIAFLSRAATLKMRRKALAGSQLPVTRGEQV